MKTRFLSLMLLAIALISAEATDYLHNTCGIVTFRAKTNEIGEVSGGGNVHYIDYLDVGRYRVTFYDSLLSGEAYQVIFMPIPGYSAGVISQSESSFDIGMKDLNGDWADCGELTTASFNRLTTPE